MSNEPVNLASMKLGLIASSTPFITGRSVTLFQNDEIYSDGAVGLALTPASSRSEPSLRSMFPGLKAITSPLRVTRYFHPLVLSYLPLKCLIRSEGNLINELDTANPTQILISAIRKAGISKNGSVEKEFYVGLLSGMDNDEV
jgi:small ligand-binding sensory domain FIST